MCVNLIIKIYLKNFLFLQIVVFIRAATIIYNSVCASNSDFLSLKYKSIIIVDRIIYRVYIPYL